MIKYPKYVSFTQNSKEQTSTQFFFFNNYFFKTFCILILVTFLIHTCRKQEAIGWLPHIVQHKLWNLNKFLHHQYYLVIYFKFYLLKKKKKNLTLFFSRTWFASLPLSFLHSSNVEPSPLISLPVSHLKPFSLHCFHK